MSGQPLRYVGIDPGRSAGLAVVEAYPGHRPVLVQAWSVHGEDHLWYPRMWRAIEEVVLTVAPPAHQLGACWVEDWVPYSREHRPRQSAWIGLGRRQGAVIATWTRLVQELPALVQVASNDRHAVGWTQVLRLGAGKVGDGSHRFREAAALVEGAGPRLDEFPVTRRLDVAEAMLIATAACFHHQGELQRARLDRCRGQA